MKKYTLIIALLTIFTWGCHQSETQIQTDTPEQRAFDEKPVDNTDNRPTDEIAFLSRVLAESDYNVTSNAASKDSHIAAFNKYALDSLKHFTNWEFTVEEVNDDQLSSSSAGKILFGRDVYNVKMIAPVKIDRSVDTTSIDNEVKFTLTIPKNPKTDTLKKQLAVIQSLKTGDIVIVSGALTHLDDKGNVNFASFYDQTLPWDIDVLQTAIVKKPEN